MSQADHAVVDFDMYKYKAAHVGEKKTIEVRHNTLGFVGEFKTRTEFWGHHAKKAGGRLAEMNAKRDSPLMPNEFDIRDVQTPEPIAHVLKTVRTMIEDDLEASGAKSFEGYLGQGDSFRVELSTMQKYKGQRDVEGAPPKPLALEAVTEYIERKFKAQYITGIEADDMCVISAYRDPRKFIKGEDKDYWGQPVNFYDVNQRSRGIVNCDKLGHLFLDKKGKVRGEGRIHMYFQMVSQDDVDNYKAHAFSDVKWGPKSAYDRLVGCETDQECWQVMYDIFTLLYPEPKEIIGWRQEPIIIDREYVMQEMLDMAQMKRKMNEPRLNVPNILDRMGVVR